MKGKLNTTSLSILRFVAVLIIVLFHRRSNSDILQDVPAILTSGPQMVSFFFVLSGFVLVLSYYGKEQFSFKKYFVKRSSRIFPIYFIALFLCLAIAFVKDEISPVATVLNLLFLQSWIPPYPLAINGPGWFISDLMSFYLFFPLLLLLLKNHMPSPKLTLIAALLLWLGTQIVLLFLLNTDFYQGYPSKSHDIIYYSPLSHLCSFLLGVAGSYWISSSLYVKLTFFKSLFLMILSILTIVFLLEQQQSINTFFNIYFPYGSSFYAPLFLLMIVVFSISNNRVASILSVKPFVTLGEMSFAVYIMQDPVWRIVSRLFKGINIPYDVILVTYIIILLFIGYITLKYIENPIKYFLRKKYAKAG